MNPNPAVVGGTLKPDGTLELDEKVNLAPGRVLVTVQLVQPPAPRGEDWWTCLQRSRAELEAAGHPFRTQEDIEAERESFRSGDERIEQVYRQIEDERRRSGKTGC